MKERGLPQNAVLLPDNAHSLRGDSALTSENGFIIVNVTATTQPMDQVLNSLMKWHYWANLLTT
jgi:hypothetical protein